MLVALKSLLSEHVNVVVALEKSCRLEVWRAEDYVNMLLGDPHFHGLVATVDRQSAHEEMEDRSEHVVDQIACQATDRIIAFIAGRILPGDAEIYKLAVQASYQRQGIGSRLIDRFLAMARDRRATNCYLEVRPSNKGAIAFYRRHGFIEHGTRARYYKEPPEDALIMLRQGEIGR
ncbi:MAG TPA: ribosomal protein S18-alanine N-acetyltransferase [Acidobacteriota bacterium]|jgi:ribosomal-protein-alanine N-acetyltransferase|nr:ribosomal protein S18-alanine N-acetyltransferase [Acidobacteriota bacterium]